MRVTVGRGDRERSLGQKTNQQVVNAYSRTIEGYSPFLLARKVNMQSKMAGNAAPTLDDDFAQTAMHFTIRSVGPLTTPFSLVSSHIIRIPIDAIVCTSSPSIFVADGIIIVCLGAALRLTMFRTCRVVHGSSVASRAGQDAT